MHAVATGNRVRRPDHILKQLRLHHPPAPYPGVSISPSNPPLVSSFLPTLFYTFSSTLFLTAAEFIYPALGGTSNSHPVLLTPTTYLPVYLVVDIVARSFL